MRSECMIAVWPRLSPSPPSIGYDSWMWLPCTPTNPTRTSTRDVIELDVWIRIRFLYFCFPLLLCPRNSRGQFAVTLLVHSATRRVSQVLSEFVVVFDTFHCDDINSLRYERSDFQPRQCHQDRHHTSSPRANAAITSSTDRFPPWCLRILFTSWLTASTRDFSSDGSRPFFRK